MKKVGFYLCLFLVISMFVVTAVTTAAIAMAMISMFEFVGVAEGLVLLG